MGQMLEISTVFPRKTVETFCCQGPWRRQEMAGLQKGWKCPLALPTVTHINTARTTAKVECEPWGTQR